MRNSRSVVYVFVHGMLSTIQKLKAYYSSFQTSAITQPSFPYPRECSEVDTSKSPLSFTYIQQLFRGISYRLFRVRVNSTGRTGILKFTRRYGKDAHVFAAKEGLAPEIWGYQELSAGWKMVLMEDLTDTHRRF
ncbi:hypothetical protein BT96DRAFT_1083642 [Gymnopus androsaceus JB14]|uniref:Uncharacterized protein n=1 Tax=Gymnopus androsaceus JB14 TaxID=1447944 RepID=A0A6A4I104_9AGAR|nr:hypothetical protein BT96DRAFT_1083642 [Gymnopus androsaceus JB14]